MKTRKFSVLFPLGHFSLVPRTLIALLATVLVLAGRPYLPAMAGTTPAAFFYPAVFLATWLGGLLPGMLSIFACSIFSIIMDRPHLLAAPGSDLPGLIRTNIFFFTSLIFVVLTSTLQKALFRKERALQMRDEFFSLASHELRTPLTSIKLHLEMLKRMMASESPDKLEEVIDAATHQASRLNYMISAMLDLTLLDTQQLLIRPTTCELSSILKEVQRSLRPLADEAKAAIELKAEGEIFGQWDQTRIEQVAFNLVHNALKFGNGSTIEISAGQGDKTAWFKVVDHGVGISKEDLGKIFERFERGQNSRGIMGVGLGLYLSSMIVKLHGGEISVKSEQGSGSEFLVKLPIKQTIS